LVQHQTEREIDQKKSGEMSINVGNKLNVEVLELNESSRNAIQSHQDSLRKLDIKTRAKSVVVPTAVEEVKSSLRSLGHPITLFGEGHYDRRERLREIMAEQELNLSEAKKWYSLAADLGHSSAMHNLGVMAYQIGNRAEAKKWYLRGAEAGDTDAMINLGVMAHDAGDQAEAKKWFKLARPNIISFEVGD
jgi:hypothetical protein